MSENEKIETILALMKELGIKAVWINNNGDAVEFAYGQD